MAEANSRVFGPGDSFGTSSSSTHGSPPPSESLTPLSPDIMMNPPSRALQPGESFRRSSDPASIGESLQQPSSGTSEKPFNRMSPERPKQNSRASFITLPLDPMQPKSLTDDDLDSFGAVVSDNNLNGSELILNESRARRRERERNQPFSVFEISATSGGRGEFKEKTLRSLLQEILAESNEIDARGNSLRRGEETNSSDGIASASLDLGGRKPGSDIRGSFKLLDSHSRATGSSYANAAVIDLRLRDLRRLDFSINQNDDFVVQVRRHCVLFTADPLRALITATRLILFVPPGADSLMTILEDYMTDGLQYISKTQEDNFDHRSNQNNLFSGDSHILTFEMLAYESILSAINDLHTQEYNSIRARGTEVLRFFQKGSLISLPIQEKMRSVKDRVSSFLSKVTNFKQALEEIGEEDEGLALMNLTVLKENPSLYSYPLSHDILCLHEEVEESLESYLSDFTALESSLTLVQSQIQSAEELVSLRLDISRNENLIANTALTVLACSIAFGAYITGAFGMNLDQTVYFQYYDGSFAIIFSISFFIIPTLFFAGYSYLRKTGTIPKRAKASSDKKTR